MYKHIFLNPFYWFGIIWMFVLVLFQFQWSTLYGKLDDGLFLFFVFIIILSFILGYFYGKLLRKHKIVYKRPNRRIVKLMLLAIAIGFILEFIYERHIPIIDEFTNSEYTYKDFEGIPSVHVFIVTFTVFCSVYFYYCRCNEKDKSYKLRFLVYSIYAFLWIATLYNRAALINIIFMCVVIKLSSLQKLKFKYFVFLFILGFIVLWGFGIFGNIRSGSKWNDSSYIMEIAHIDEDKYPPFLPKELSWAYVYIISPLGNLNEQVINGNCSYDFVGFLYYIFPDALSKRIWPFIDTSFELKQPLLTVCTGFAGAFKYGGILGMFGLFLCMSLLIFFIGHLTCKKSSSFIVSTAFLTCMAFLMFFDDIFNFTGFTFSLFFSIIIVFIKDKQNYSKKSNLCNGSTIKQSDTKS